MSDLPPLPHRIVRVVHRFGGSGGDAAKAIGCSKLRACVIARKIGLSFGGSIQVGAIRSPDPFFPVGCSGLSTSQDQRTSAALPA